MCVQACPVSRQLARDGGLTLTWCSVLFGGSGTVRGISVIFGNLCQTYMTCDGSREAPKQTHARTE